MLPPAPCDGQDLAERGGVTPRLTLPPCSSDLRPGEGRQLRGPAPAQAPSLEQLLERLEQLYLRSRG